MWIPRRSALLRVIRPKDYLLLDMRIICCCHLMLFVLAVYSGSWSLCSACSVGYLLPSVGLPKLFLRRFLAKSSRVITKWCVMCAPAMWLLYALKWCYEHLLVQGNCYACPYMVSWCLHHCAHGANANELLSVAEACVFTLLSMSPVLLVDVLYLCVKP